MACIERRHNLRVVGGGDGTGRSAVERLAKGNYFFPTGHERGKLKRILIGFCAGVAEEELVVCVTGELPKFVGELSLK